MHVSELCFVALAKDKSRMNHLNTALPRAQMINRGQLNMFEIQIIRNWKLSLL